MELEGTTSLPASWAGVSKSLPSPTCPPPALPVAAPSPAAAAEQPAPQLAEFTDHHAH